MTDDPLSVIHEPDDEAIRAVVDGIQQYGIDAIGGCEPQRLAVLSSSAQGEVHGGGVGHEILGVFYVTHLWVAPQFRNQGLGGRLVAALEEEADRLGCTEVRLDTLNARTLPFYARHGYEVYASLPDYVPGFERVFLRKPPRKSNPAINSDK